MKTRPVAALLAATVFAAAPAAARPTPPPPDGRWERLRLAAEFSAEGPPSPT